MLLRWGRIVISHVLVLRLTGTSTWQKSCHIPRETFRLPLLSKLVSVFSVGLEKFLSVVPKLTFCRCVLFCYCHLIRYH